MNKDNFYNFLNELRTRCDIVSVISKYCIVKQRGRYYWACCPFHMEKTASLCIYDDEQTFYCFGCKEFGDVIRFTSKIESCDYIQAVEILAKSVNMEIPAIKGGKDNFAQRKKERDTALAILDEANKYYQQKLYEPRAKIAQDYIKKRGLTRRELIDFGLGYSDSGYGVIKHLKSMGYTIKQLESAGIVSNSDEGYFDSLSHRLTFPLYNIYGECVGFSARILIDDKTKAKYKNTPTTMVFDKSKTVFGLNLVRKYKQTNVVPNIIIVEGQMDVIAMHKAGFKNTVACLGTAFTEGHAKLIKLISDNAILCLDGDDAGMRAANKNADILAKYGFNVKCIAIPGGMDPDEYIKANGKEQMQAVLDSAINYIDFQIDYLAKGVDFTKSDEKAKFVNSAIALLGKLKTSSEKQVYLDHIKRLSGVPIDILQQDVFYLGTQTDESKDIFQTKAVGVEDGTNRAAKFILASMLHKKDYAQNVNIRGYLHNDIYIKLYDLIQKSNATGEKIIISSLLDEFSEGEEENLVDIINYNFDQNGNNEKYYKECLWCLAEKHFKQQLSQLNEKYKNCEDINERKKILLEITEVSKKLKNREVED